MIIGFAGTPGSGKTYEAVKKITDNLQMGRVVYTNIDGMSDPECLEMIKSYCGLSDLALCLQLHFLRDDQLADFWMHIKPGCLVVLDEVQKVFSSREWQTAKNNQFASWASTHRHNGFDVVLITQAVERIDSAVRAHEQAIFRCYKSYVAKDVKELGVMQHVNVLKHPVFFAIPIVLILTLYMIFSKSSIGTGDLFGSKQAMTTHTQKPAQQLTTGPIVPIERNGQLVFTNRKEPKQ